MPSSMPPSGNNSTRPSSGNNRSIILQNVSRYRVLIYFVWQGNGRLFGFSERCDCFQKFLNQMTLMFGTLTQPLLYNDLYRTMNCADNIQSN